MGPIGPDQGDARHEKNVRGNAERIGPEVIAWQPFRDAPLRFHGVHVNVHAVGGRGFCFKGSWVDRLAILERDFEISMCASC